MDSEGTARQRRGPAAGAATGPGDRLGREIGVVLLVKTAALILLWAFFFRGSSELPPKDGVLALTPHSPPISEERP